MQEVMERNARTPLLVSAQGNRRFKPSRWQTGSNPFHSARGPLAAMLRDSLAASDFRSQSFCERVLRRNLCCSTLLHKHERWQEALFRQLQQAVPSAFAEMS